MYICNKKILNDLVEEIWSSYQGPSLNVMLLMFMPCCRLQPTLKAFGTGYLLQLVPMLLGQIKHIIARPGLFYFLCTVVCKSIHHPGESLNEEIIIICSYHFHCCCHQHQCQHHHHHHHHHHDQFPLHHHHPGQYCYQYPCSGS